MKPGAVTYWHCGGEVLTRCLGPGGRLAARAVSADEARALIGFYGDGAEADALRIAMEKADAWARASGGYAAAARRRLLSTGLIT